MMNTYQDKPHQSHSQGSNTEYQFQLKTKAAFPFYKGIVCDFSPVKALNLDQKNQQIKQYSIIPTFNHDIRFYSQTFLTHYDGLDSDQKLWSKHKAKVKQISQQIASNKIYVPKPRKHHHRDPHCHVCRINYSDYLTHVNTDSHKTQIKLSRFQEYIIEIVNSILIKQYPSCMEAKYNTKRHSLRIKALRQRK